jgi:hypothetical protein
MEHNLVRIVGRSDGIGKPMLFGTTREFLMVFGLKSLADLPKPKELEELMSAAGSGGGERNSEDGSVDGEGFAAAGGGLDEHGGDVAAADRIPDLSADQADNDREADGEAVAAPDERGSVP